MKVSAQYVIVGSLLKPGTSDDSGLSHVIRGLKKTSGTYPQGYQNWGLKKTSGTYHQGIRKGVKANKRDISSGVLKQTLGYATHGSFETCKGCSSLWNYYFKSSSTIIHIAYCLWFTISGKKVRYGIRSSGVFEFEYLKKASHFCPFFSQWNWNQYLSGYGILSIRTYLCIDIPYRTKFLRTKFSADKKFFRRTNSKFRHFCPPKMFNLFYVLTWS